MFNLFDLVAGLVIVAAGFFGYQTGLLASVFYMVSGFVGMFVAQKFAAQLGINFYVLFFLAAAVVVVAGFMLGRLLKSVFLSPADRLSGFLLGAVLGVVVVVAVAVPLAGNLLPKTKKTVETSFSVTRVMPRLQRYVPEVADFTPVQVKRALPRVAVPDALKPKLSVTRTSNTKQ